MAKGVRIGQTDRYMTVTGDPESLAHGGPDKILIEPLRGERGRVGFMKIDIAVLQLISHKFQI